MNDNTTIVIFTKNNHKKIVKTIKLLKEYCKKYHNITQIMFIDNQSTDGTPQRIKKEIAENSKLRIICHEKEKNQRTLFLECEKDIHTPNTIIFEPELYTRLHQIQRQIKKLRKTDLLLPSRFHKKSKTIYTQKMSELRDKGRNFATQLMTGLEYTDPTNPNKAFKTRRIMPLIKKTKSKRNFWIELIILCKKKKMRITETKTHYVQEEKPSVDKLTQFIRDMKELRLLSKTKK